MRHRHGNGGVLANRNGTVTQRLAIHRECNVRHTTTVAAAKIIHPHHHLRRLANNGEARRIDDTELAVALAALSRDQHLQRRLQAHLRRRRRVMHLAVGDQDRAGNARRRHIGQRGVQRCESLGAIILAAGGGGDFGLPDDEVGLARQFPADLRQRLFRLRQAITDAHALGAIHDHRHHIGQRHMIFMHQHRPRQREQQNGKSQPARPGAPRPRIKAIRRQAQRGQSQHGDQGQRHMRIESQSCHSVWRFTCGPASPAMPAHAPGRSCNCRSGHTSPD